MLLSIRCLDDSDELAESSDLKGEHWFNSFKLLMWLQVSAHHLIGCWHWWHMFMSCQGLCHLSKLFMWNIVLIYNFLYLNNEIKTSLLLKSHQIYACWWPTFDLHHFSAIKYLSEHMIFHSKFAEHDILSLISES